MNGVNNSLTEKKTNKLLRETLKQWSTHREPG